MLTATYSLVAITAEQEKSRRLFGRVQQFVEASWRDLRSIDFAPLEAGFQRVLQFDQFLRNRKIEQILIPALRGLSREADQLIAEFDSLAAHARRLLQGAASQLAARADFTRGQAGLVFEAMQAYCSHIGSRLRLEEQSLLPLARRLLSMEDWFRLASEFLSRDERRSRRLPASPPVRPPEHARHFPELR